MIFQSRKLDYVIHYRDLEFLDDETEYFKRYYAGCEIVARIRKLLSTPAPTQGRLLRDQHERTHSMPAYPL